jgi:hypothetical protein
MINKHLKQNNKGSLKPISTTYDSRNNIISESALNLNNSPLYYINNKVSNLGSTFNNNARVKLKYGNVELKNKHLLNKIYGDYTNYPGNLYPKHNNTTFLNLKSNGNYYVSNNIVKMDKYGSYFKFGNNKIYY